jgi:serine/threonine-protein kinase
MSLADVRTELERHGFASVVERELHTPDFGEGRVVEQRPAAGRVLRKGRKVYLTVSLGVRRTELPGVVGLSVRQAGIILRREGLRVGSVARVPHPDVTRDVVISQDPPAGASRPEGSRIDLLVSLGPPPIAYRLPDLTGRPAREVEALLREHDIRIGARTVLIDRSVLPATVLEHDPPAGSRVSSGGEVHLTVSSRS